MAYALVHTAYAAPPYEANARGEPRRVGLELELAGLSIDVALRVIRTCFGGSIEALSPTQGRVQNTTFGSFKVEYDSRAMRERSYLKPLERMGLETDSITAQIVEESVIQLMAEVIPIEIITPPVPWHRLAELDPLWSALRDAGAQDTYSSVFHAFGLHLNPETPDGEVSTVLAFLRAFLLLEDWIVDASQLDLSRRIAPFIRPFPEVYRRKVLEPRYRPRNGAELIADYVHSNPTRNRGLDLLPLFVHFFGDAFLTHVEEAALVNARPTYHYRMPNCELASPGWSPRADWNRWLAIEHLAADAALLDQLSRAYLATLDLPLRLQSIGWLDELRARISLPGEARGQTKAPVGRW